MIYIENKQFTTITSAIAAVPKDNSQEVIINIPDGEYHEVVIIDKPNVTLIGAQNTTITFNNHAQQIMKDGSKRGTFRSYTVLVDAINVKLINLTIENSSGNGDIVGQAIALYAEKDGLVVSNCKIIGHQDTLFTGPLPLKEKELNGFIGPKQFSQRIIPRLLFENTYIEGDIDFIFGSAIAYFDHCTIFSKNRNKDINGYICAISTYENCKYGYVFNHCRFLSDCKDNTVYLGRCWREHAKCTIINSFIDKHIIDEGYSNWNCPDPRETTCFLEKNNYGPKANAKRVDWVYHDFDEAEYTKEKVLSYKFN